MQAAECFTLAGCYETAAEIYAKQNCLSKCLAVCSKGHLYEKGFKFVENWKPGVQYNGKDDRGKEIDRIKQEFLESCASNYFQWNARTSMMKFVKAFRLMDDKRQFLKTRNCMDELFLLEEETGNFVEVAELAKLKGDLLVEAELLGKAGNFCNATSLILSYVLANSLWGHGCEPWPLKSFDSKKELLNKAGSFARNEPDLFYESVCTEAMVLEHERRNLCELRCALSASRKYGSLSGEILCLRKIIDVHTETEAPAYSWQDEFPVDLKFPNDTMYSNQLSVGTLCHFWNLWKGNLLQVLESLKCLKMNHDFGKYKDFGNFCLNYLGVRRMFTDLKASYTLLIPDAEWVTNASQTFMRQMEKMVSIDEQHYITAAQRYWHNEVLSVGLKVMQILESLYNYSVESLSQFRQSLCLVNIYQISKFFLSSMSLNCNKNDGKVEMFFELSMKYFDIVFPLHFQKSMDQDMILLRGTEVSCSLLNDFIIGDIRRTRKLTLGQTGRLMMIWFGSGKPTREVCNKVLARTPRNSKWIALIKILSVKEPRELLPSFNWALQKTYQFNWQNMSDYISPHCFLYLMERLLFLVFSSSCGFFYTTKSSFLEWLMYQKPGTCVIPSFSTELPHGKKYVYYESIVSMVEELLVKRNDTGLWIEKSGIKTPDYHRLLDFRLVLILCSVYINSEESLDVLNKVLNMHHILSELPREFTQVFMQTFMDRGKVAEALQAIGNPVFLLCLNETTPKVCPPNVILIQLEIDSCREDIMEMVFPKRGQVVEVPEKKSCCSLTPSGCHGKKSEKESTLQMKWCVLDEEASISHYSKEDLDECIRFTTAVANYLSEKDLASCGVDTTICVDIESMIQELKQLSDYLDTSYPREEHKENIGEVQKRLLLRKPIVEGLFNSIVVDKDSGEVVFAESEGYNKHTNANATS